MDFTSKEDVDFPIKAVFEALSDFESFERSAIRRGIEVQRLGDMGAPAAGMAWDAKFHFRGKPRDMRIETTEYTPDTQMSFVGETSGLQGTTTIELIALAPNRTRISVSLALEAKTLSGRLLVQSLKLARSKLTRRFESRIKDLSQLIAGRLSQTA